MSSSGPRTAVSDHRKQRVPYAPQRGNRGTGASRYLTEGNRADDSAAVPRLCSLTSGIQEMR